MAFSVSMVLDLGRAPTFKGGMWDASQSCRCVARETGEPVFGLETDVTAAQDMTCACATQVNIGQIAVAKRGGE